MPAPCLWAGRPNLGLRIEQTQAYLVISNGQSVSPTPRKRIKMDELITWLPAELASLPRYVVALAIGLLPLAIPLFYWRTPARALLLAGMVSLFYFCHGVAEAWAAPSERALAGIEIALAVVVILACARLPKRRRETGSKLPAS